MRAQPGHRFAHPGAKGLAAGILRDEPFDFRVVEHPRMRLVALEGAGQARDNLADEIGRHFSTICGGGAPRAWAIPRTWFQVSASSLVMWSAPRPGCHFCPAARPGRRRNLRGSEADGKNASEAATQPFSERTAFIAPNLAASTRLDLPGADTQCLPIASIDNCI